MWEFLIKQDSGLYKPKSIANLEFIEQYYSFDESQSNADAMLGEILPFTYDGTNVTFENESSLSDSGTYFPFAQIDCYNNLQMLAASNTVADAKTALLEAIATYGVKLVRVIHISTDVPFQPLPGGGGVTPADLALKQDIQLATPIKVLKWQTEATQVEQALATIKSSILQMDAFAYNNRLIYKAPSTTANDGAIYYKIASLTLSYNAIVKGVIAETFTTKDGQGEIISHHDDCIAFDIVANFNGYTTPHSCVITGYYDNILEHCDIIVASDDCIYVKLYKQGSENNSYIRCIISGGYDYEEADPISSLPTGVEVIASMKDSATNLKAVPSPGVLALKQDKDLENALVINGNATYTVEHGLYGLAEYTSYTDIYNSLNETRYYLLTKAMVSATIVEGVFNTWGGEIGRFECLARLYESPPTVTGTYYNALPTDCDIVVTASGLYAKLPPNTSLYVRMCMNSFDSDHVVVSTLDEPILASLSASGINLSEGGSSGESGIIEINPLALLLPEPIDVDSNN